METVGRLNFDSFEKILTPNKGCTEAIEFVNRISIEILNQFIDKSTTNGNEKEEIMEEREDEIATRAI